MANTKYSIFKGETSPVIKISVNGYPTLDDDWTGQMVLLEDFNAEPTLTRAINHDTQYYTAVWTPSETDTLTEGIKYRWIIEITNTTLSIPFTKKLHLELIIRAAGI
jgi:hypothetical protein